CNGFLEDGWIRGHPAQPVLLDQPSERRPLEKIAANVVIPNALAELSQPHEAIQSHELPPLSKEKIRYRCTRTRSPCRPDPRLPQSGGTVGSQLPPAKTSSLSPHL